MAGGWGNLGGGFVQAFIPGVFELFKAMGCAVDLAWRLSLLVPAFFFLLVGLFIWNFSDDCPEGKWCDRIRVVKEEGSKESKWDVFNKAVLNRNTIPLVLLYGCCFGIELFVNNAAALFLYEQFLTDSGENILTQSTAGLIASMFGLMNLFARALGGWASDKAAAKYGIAGRFWVLLITTCGTGGMMIIFGVTKILPLAMIFLVLFSLNVQAAEGATFGIVPFVDPEHKGVVSGLVGAGGNLGAVIWGLIYKQFGQNNMEREGFICIGCVVISSGFLCAILKIRGRSMFCGTEEVDGVVPQVAAKEIKTVETAETC
jgi:NNP family nitrate/nitrite transporter-like MFS transporter